MRQTKEVEGIDTDLIEAIREGRSVEDIFRELAGKIEGHLPEKYIGRLDRKIIPAYADEDFCISLPYSHLNWDWIYDHEIYGEAYNCLRLGRLDSIKSLSRLAAVSSVPDQYYLRDFSHTRSSHSLLVARVAEKTAWQNNLPEEDVKLIIVAHLLHDQGTPALGNPVMAVDYPNLNEEDFWWDGLEESGGGEFLKRHHVNKEAVDLIIHNKGVFGRYLDIFDRIIYTAEDAYALVGPVIKEDKDSPGITDPTFGEICQEIAKNPYFGDLYQEVKIDDQNQTVFFTNPERLYSFLKIRALLTQKIYLHPLNQARDVAITELVKPFYAFTLQPEDEKKFFLPEELTLTPYMLRRMNDLDLINYLNVFYFGRYFMRDKGLYSNFIDTNYWNPQFKELNDKNDKKNVEEVKKEIVHKNPGILFLGGVKIIPGFNPAINYLVDDGDGRVLSFREYNPQKAAELEEIARSTKKTCLLYVDTSEYSVINDMLNMSREKKLSS